MNVHATTIGYLAESNGYDQPLAVTVDARLPRPWLMKALGLRLGDGRAIHYVDGDGRVVFQDPTAEGGSPTTALVDRTAFLKLLTQEKLAVVSLIAGGEERLRLRRPTRLCPRFTLNGELAHDERSGDEILGSLGGAAKGCKIPSLDLGLWKAAHR